MEITGIVLGLVFIAIVLAGVIGWVMNIVKLITQRHAPITGVFVLRLVGIFVPIIGAVMGWI